MTKSPPYSPSAAKQLAADSGEMAALPGRPSPVGPGWFAEHFVAFQTRLVGLAEGVSCPPYTDILHEAKVVHLVADQGLGEDVGGLLFIGFDAPGM